MQVSQAMVISLIYHRVNSKKASSKLEEKTATHFPTCQKELKRLRNCAKQFLSKLDQQSQITKGLGKELEPIIRTFSARDSSCETHPSVNLCRSRMLIVGGHLTWYPFAGG